jgi:hypothetical protein
MAGEAQQSTRAALIETGMVRPGISETVRARAPYLADLSDCHRSRLEGLADEVWVADQWVSRTTEQSPNLRLPFGSTPNQQSK